MRELRPRRRVAKHLELLSARPKTQDVMILTSLFAMRLGEKRRLWIVPLISFAALPIRGILAAVLISKWSVYPVQFLDGVGAGLHRPRPLRAE
jgi:hypothetical protein